MSDLIPIKLAEQAMEVKEKVIAGLMEDNKRLKKRVQLIEDLAEENRSEFEKLWAENERLRKDLEWQPIETAPKGMEVLVVEYGYIYIGIFDKDGYCDDTDGAGLDPSHWMPIPPFNEQAKGVQS